MKKDGPWLQPGTHRQSQSQSRLFKRSRVSTRQTHNLLLLPRHLCPNLFLSEVAEPIPSTLRKMPQLSEPRPLGMRAEHGYDFGAPAGNSYLFVQVVAHIAAASVPHSVLQYLKAGQITALAAPTGGHRPLLMMSFLRRLALKSVTAAKKESVAKCAGPLQHAAWSGTTRWCKHDDQDRSVPCGG